MAFGSAAPEMIINVIATIQSQVSESSSAPGLRVIFVRPTTLLQLLLECLQFSAAG